MIYWKGVNNLKIVHIAPNATYNEGWGYQENLLPKYQVIDGHNVTLVTTIMKHHNGKIIEIDESDYMSEDGVRIIRRKYKKFINKKLTHLFSYIFIEDLLEELKPDMIFFHGLVSASILDVIKYIKKNKECFVVQDNHMDYRIGPPSKTFLQKCQWIWYRLLNKYSIKYVKKVYGVTPWRKEYAEEKFGISPEKTDILVMGADDDKIPFSKMPKLREDIRKSFNLTSKDFIIITGGKIDRKKNVHVLMEAIATIKEENIKLLIFGEVDEEIKDIFKKWSSSKKIYILGWIPGDQVYKYFLASDLAVFPGQHSVLWEQACGCGIPCMFKKWPGMHHVDVGGNSFFLNDAEDVEIIKNDIYRIYIDKERYKKMKKIAIEKGIPAFSYAQIARRAIEK